LWGRLLPPITFSEEHLLIECLLRQHLWQWLQWLQWQQWQQWEQWQQLRRGQIKRNRASWEAYRTKTHLRIYGEQHEALLRSALLSEAVKDSEGWGG